MIGPWFPESVGQKESCQDDPSDGARPLPSAGFAPPFLHFSVSFMNLVSFYRKVAAIKFFCGDGLRIPHGSFLPTILLTIDMAINGVWRYWPAIIIRRWIYPRYRSQTLHVYDAINEMVDPPRIQFKVESQHWIWMECRLVISPYVTSIKTVATK